LVDWGKDHGGKKGKRKGRGFYINFGVHVFGRAEKRESGGGEGASKERRGKENPRHDSKKKTEDVADLALTGN